MKNLSAGFIAIFMAVNVFGQSPDKISYQSIIRNATGALVKNSTVGIKVSILQYTSNGSAVYAETQTPSTDANGLISIEIGSGTLLMDALSTVDWSMGPYFIKVETDPTGGTNYTISGVSQILSVPYALQAKKANTSSDNMWNTYGSDIYNLNNGNVGIGVVSPNATLSVARGTAGDGTAAFIGTSHVSHFNYSVDENTYIRGGKDNSNVIINDIPGGKVGIGMSNPQYAMLEQYGTVGSTAAIFGGGNTGVSLQANWPAIGLNHYYDGNTSRAIGIGYGAQIYVDQSIGVGGGAVGICNFSPRVNAAHGPLLNPVARVFFQNGRIGIGTNDPQCDIDINQDWNQTPLGGIRWNDPVQGSNCRLEFSGNYLRYFYNNNYVAYLNSSGSWYSTSDSTLKKDIRFLKSGTLAKLKNVFPVTYHLKKEPNGTTAQYGFISQNIQEVFPELVNETSGIKMLNYQGMIPVAVQAINEMNDKLEALQTENKLLEERLKKLEKMVKDAEKE